MPEPTGPRCQETTTLGLNKPRTQAALRDAVLGRPSPLDHVRDADSWQSQ